MAKKKKQKKQKKQTTTEKREIRLRKAKQWITTYNGTPKKIASHYHKRFHVDIVTATNDLQAIGVEFTQEYLDAVKRSEEERVRQLHLKKEKKKQQEFDLYEDSDDNFAFIAGYTPGGAPYGITWEELGISPYAPYEELMAAYDRMDHAVNEEADLFDEWDEDDLFGTVPVARKKSKPAKKGLGYSDMSIAKEYIEGLKNAYMELGISDEWKHFEAVKYGANGEKLDKIKSIYPDCPEALLEMLAFADGTYHRKYGDEIICLYFFGSDISEYPYYLLSADEISQNQNIASEYYGDYIERAFDEVEVDKRITDNLKGIKWLHFSDCMNNGGTSQLFIDFTPSEHGKKGQVVRFIHDPDELTVIAESFEEYLKMIMENEYDFINEDIID